MKRHEIINALRQYTDHTDLQAMLAWGTASLERYLYLCENWGKSRAEEVRGGSVFRPTVVKFPVAFAFIEVKTETHAH